MKTVLSSEVNPRRGHDGESIFKPEVIAAIGEIKRQLKRPCPLYVVILIISAGCVLGGYGLIRLQNLRRWNLYHYHERFRSATWTTGYEALLIHERHRETMKKLPAHVPFQVGQPETLKVPASRLAKDISDNRCGTISMHGDGPYELLITDDIRYPIHRRFFEIEKTSREQSFPLTSFRFDKGIPVESRGSGYSGQPETQTMMFVTRPSSAPSRKVAYFHPRYEAHYYLDERGKLYEIMIKDKKVVGWRIDLTFDGN